MDTLSIDEFNKLYKKYGRMLYKIGNNYPSLQEDDIESAIYTSIWEAWKTQDGRNICTYLYKIMSNAMCVLLIKQKSKRRPHLHCKNILYKFEPKIEYHDPLELPPSLSDTEGQVVRLIMDEYTHADISKILSVSATRVGRIKDNAFEKIRTYYRILNRI